MKILTTGLTGLVGSRFAELLGSAYDFDNLGLENGINILDKKAVLDAVLASDAPLILHMAAKTNVDGCETEKERDQEILAFKTPEEKEKAWVEEQTAWGVNVYGTQNIVDACKKTGKKILYISTDFVFDGTKKNYSEEDKPNPLNWYAKTKYEGEKLIQDSGIEYIIARTSYPYRAMFERNDFVRGIIAKLEKGESINMITDHIIVPTFIDDLSNALDILITTNQIGIFHVVGSQKVNPYEASLKIAQVFDLDASLIGKTTRREYFAGKAARPFALYLKNDKIGKVGIEMSTFDKGLREIKNQIDTIHI